MKELKISLCVHVKKLKRLEEDNSDYKEKYYDKYMNARKESGFKDTPEEMEANFLKFLVEDAQSSWYRRNICYGSRKKDECTTQG